MFLIPLLINVFILMGGLLLSPANVRANILDAASAPRIEEAAIKIPNAPTADHTVGSGCTYATIAAAISAANPNDRILIEGGVTFEENIVINKNLTLEGGYDGCSSGSTARTTIDGGANGRVIEITSGSLDVWLNNLNITNGSHAYGSGIWVGPDNDLWGTNISIHGNTATLYGAGLRLYGARATFDNTTISNNTAPIGAGVAGMLYAGYVPQLNLPSNTKLLNNQALTGEGLGGGVYMHEGTIWLANCSVIDSNDAIDGGGAYLITSTLTVQGDCAEIRYNMAIGNGGGIYAQGSRIDLDEGARLYGNQAGISGTGSGGGAYLDNSELWGDKASISANIANGHGGGVYATQGSLVDLDLGSYPCSGPRCSQLNDNTAANGHGGGIYANTNSEIDLRNTFIEGNTALSGGGIYAFQSPVYAYNDLFAKNDATDGAGDGIMLVNGAGMSASGTTLAYNDAGGAGTGSAIVLSTASLTMTGSIIWGHATSIDTPGQTVNCSDIQGGYTGTDNIDQDPIFIAPGSSDFHLHSSSPAIDQCVYFYQMNTDFDNQSRPMVHNNETTPYDMGADEAGLFAGINGNGCMYGSIQQAVDAVSPGDTIQAAAQMYMENIKITSKDLIIVGGYDSTCTIPISGTTTIDGGSGSGSVFEISSSKVTLSNLDIMGGDSGFGGGVSLPSGNSRVTLDNTNVFSNQASLGGGVYLAIGNILTSTNGSDIHHNTATSFGGGIYIYGGAVTLTNAANIYANQAHDGAGIYAQDAHVYLEEDNTTITNNSAANDGGGVYLTNESTLNLVNGPTIAHNQALNGAGGGIAATGDPTINVSDAALQNNSARTYGGAIYINGGTLQIGYAYLHGNSAVSGGALWQGGSAASQVENSLIYNNSVRTPAGAGIYAAGGTCSLNHVTLANNTGGPAFLVTGASSEIFNSIAWGNTAGVSGTLTAASCNIDQAGNAGISINPQFITPGLDYHLLGGSPAINACATGLSADLEHIPRPISNGYDMGAYEYRLGVKFTPDNASSSGQGQIISYAHILTNSGYMSDTFTLSASSSQDWAVKVDPALSVTLAGGLSVPITVRISIPADIPNNTVDTTNVTASSSTDPNLTASVVDTTTVVTQPDIIVTPLGLSVVIDPGGRASRTLAIENAGNIDLTWSLAENPARSWLSASPSSGAIPPSGNASVTLNFNASGLIDGIYKTLLQISSNDPDKQQVNVPVTLVVRSYKVYLPLATR